MNNPNMFQDPEIRAHIAETLGLAVEKLLETAQLESLPPEIKAQVQQLIDQANQTQNYLKK